MTTGRHMDPGQMDPEFAKFRAQQLSKKADPQRLEPNAKAPPPAREPVRQTPGAMPRPTARSAPSSGVIEPNAHAAAGAHRSIATPGEGTTSNNAMPMFGTAQFQQPKEEPDPRRMKLSDLNLDVVKPPNDHVPIGESLKLIDIALEPTPTQRPPQRPGPTGKTPPSLAARPASPNIPPRPGQPPVRVGTRPPGPTPTRPPQVRPPQGGPARPPQPGSSSPRVPSADRVSSQPGITAPPSGRLPRPTAPTVRRSPSGRLIPIGPADGAPPRPQAPNGGRTTTRRLKGPRR